MFAIAEEAGVFCIEVFFFRTYQNWGNRAYFPRADKSLEPGEVLGAFLAQFYADKPAARLVLLSHEIDDRAVARRGALGARRPSRRGRRAAARREARTGRSGGHRTAARRWPASSPTAPSQEKLLAALAASFGIERKLRRVEVYDNSHIMGTNAVGAMIVAGPEGFMKNHYRTFNIKGEDLVAGDDTAMMREVLRRRFARLEEGGVRGARRRSGRVATGTRLFRSGPT